MNKKILAILVLGAMAIPGGYFLADYLSRPQPSQAAPGWGTMGQPTPTPDATLSSTSLSLKVRTLEKECFGSAGCNVQYRIDLELSAPMPADECEVTYEVTGLTDPQVGTLVMNVSGKYTQDDYQSGETVRSSAKLKVKVIDTLCH